MRNEQKPLSPALSPSDGERGMKLLRTGLPRAALVPPAYVKSTTEGRRLPWAIIG